MQRLIESSNLEEKDKKDILDALNTKRLDYRTKGSIFRARCRWHNEGEKNTKYFLNLEKRHYKQGVISQLKLGNKSFVTTDKEILSECETFTNVYTALTMVMRANVQMMFSSGRKRRKG